MEVMTVSTEQRTKSGVPKGKTPTAPEPHDVIITSNVYTRNKMRRVHMPMVK